MSNWAVKDLIKKIFQHKRDYNNRKKNKNKEQRQHQHQQKQQEQHQYQQKQQKQQKHHQNQQEKHQYQQRQQKQQEHHQDQQEKHQHQQEQHQYRYEDSGKYLFKFIYILLLLQSELDIMIFNITNFTLNQFFKILTLGHINKIISFS